MENKLEDLCFYTKLAKKTISAFANNIYSGLSSVTLERDVEVWENYYIPSTASFLLP